MLWCDPRQVDSEKNKAFLGVVQLLLGNLFMLPAAVHDIPSVFVFQALFVVVRLYNNRCIR